MGPDYIVIGAMKCGTSTVCAYLEDHPRTFMVSGCEPNFFSHDKVFVHGREAYERLFDPARGLLCGEGSNAYSNAAQFPHSARRIASLYPGVKIIYLVRHPLHRIRSAWVQKRVDSGDDIRPTLDRAVREQPDLFVDQSLYWRNLSQYRAQFDDHQIFIGFLEEMERDRAAFFNGLCAFLEIPPTHQTTRIHQNPSRGKRMPSPRYSVANKLPFVRSLKKLTPAPLRRVVKDRLLSVPANDLPSFSIDTRRHLLELIANDALRFLSHTGKPADFWDLSV